MGCKSSTIVKNSRSLPSNQDTLLNFKGAPFLTCKGKTFTAFLDRKEDVYDGDTVNLIHYSNFSHGEAIKSRCRIIGIDSPELRNRETKSQGLKSRDFLRSLLETDKIYTVIGYGEDKYGRYLVDIILSDQKSVKQLMLNNGYATPYDGGTKKSQLE